jgi:hypothetical protein
VRRPGGLAGGAPAPAFIVTLDPDAQLQELAALKGWVKKTLLPVYGREISTTAPWCSKWAEHPEAVARLHGLWLAWQELTAPTAGRTGPAIWHRDHLDHVMAQLRSPAGPFAACTTNANRPAHRLLAPPGSEEEATPPGPSGPGGAA